MVGDLGGETIQCYGCTDINSYCNVCVCMCLRIRYLNIITNIHTWLRRYSYSMHILNRVLTVCSHIHNPLTWAEVLECRALMVCTYNIYVSVCAISTAQSLNEKLLGPYCTHHFTERNGSKMEANCSTRDSKYLQSNAVHQCLANSY